MLLIKKKIYADTKFRLHQKVCDFFFFNLTVYDEALGEDYTWNDPFILRSHSRLYYVQPYINWMRHETMLFKTHTNTREQKAHWEETSLIKDVGFT